MGHPWAVDHFMADLPWSELLVQSAECDHSILNEECREMESIKCGAECGVQCSAKFRLQAIQSERVNSAERGE